MKLRELAAGNRHTTNPRITSEDPGKWKRISDSKPADDSTEYALSITAPLDLLRTRMQLDLARRKKYQQRARNDLTSQQKLHNLGKRAFSATYWFSRYRNRLSS
ncbi:hypothetical protein RvY_13474 [Ramazzottius varieornatus]|uniref:Corticotropin-releasing factor domain-containing protein n=1 Tax=Ramazzottius varieornatus TaxID=947166 RepID=A0A1D1VMZ5_RAMVA|nr:hypothetical protein RvY_13474 [Ramazzottius varieornatus]